MFDHEKLKVYFRDSIVDFSEANISIANTGFMYGLGVFTGIRAHYNEPEDKLYIFRLKDHFERFSFSCKLARYENFFKNYDYQKFEKIIRDLIAVNKLKEDIYIRVTNFSDENRVTPKFIGYKDSICAFLYPIGNYVPTTGMRCKVSSWTRVEDNAITASAKFNGIYVNTAFAKTEALKDGYDEAIFLDRDGHVVEGSAENVFIVRDGELITPSSSSNILEGITRRTVIDIASDMGINVVQRSIDRTELYKADEVFLTGTGAQVSPVIDIDKYQVGNGEVGPISKEIQGTYFKAVRGEVSKYKSWLVEV